MYEPSYLNISCTEDKLQENTFATGYFHLSTNLHLFAISYSIMIQLTGYFHLSTNLHLFAISYSIMIQLMCHANRDALDLQILGIDIRIGFFILVAGAEDIPSVLFDELFQVVLAFV